MTRRSPRMRVGTAALAAVTVLALPATATAGTVSMDGFGGSQFFTYDSRLVDDPGTADRVVLRIVRGSSASVRHDRAVVLPTAESPDATASALAQCTFLIGEARCSGNVQDGEILLHAGNDVGIIEGPHGGAIYGGRGKDVLRGGRGDDELYGDADGTLMESSEEASADQFFGGDGEDRVITVFANRGVNITLDDQANDGAPGEGDNVHSDVEWVTASGQLVNRLVGNELANRLSGRGELIGGGGADDLRGSFHADTLDGGPGEDTIDGGGAGADLIRANDGERDVVDCGAGNDTVEADELDQVENCEIVEIP